MMVMATRKEMMMSMMERLVAGKEASKPGKERVTVPREEVRSMSGLGVIRRL